MLLFHINAHVRVKVHARIYIRLRVCEAQYIFKIWNQSKLVFSLSNKYETFENISITVVFRYSISYFYLIMSHILFYFETEAKPLS